ncbi:hypothetical protein WGV93_09430, partial [Campylobacter jejuni]
RMGRNIDSIPAETLRTLSSMEWPGNVRELEHAIHRAVVLARATRSGDEVVIHARHFAQHDEIASIAQAVPERANENL